MSNKLIALAKGVDYPTFLDRTDSVALFYDLLYRGGPLHAGAFMSDYVGHAKEYSDDPNTVDGLIGVTDILRIDDRQFDALRREFADIDTDAVERIYRPFFGTRLNDTMPDGSDVASFVVNFVRSDTPYSEVQASPSENDALVPLMLHYAGTKGKNVISFWGGDYSDYGGATEYVVSDPSRYRTLSSVWKEANARGTRIEALLNGMSAHGVIEN